MKLVTISSKNQITIPAEYLRSLGLSSSSKVLVEKKNKKILLTPVKKSIVDEVAGSLTHLIPKGKLGKTLKGIDEGTRNAVVKHLAKKWKL